MIKTSLPLNLLVAAVCAVPAAAQTQNQPPKNAPVSFGAVPQMTQAQQENFPPQLLEQLVRAHSTPQALAFRARLILRCAQPDKPTNLQVAAELSCDPDTVARWRNRFVRQRLQGLRDLPRVGRPRAFSP